MTKVQRQNPEASPFPLLTAVPDASMPGVNPEGFYQTPNSMAVKAIRAKLTAADWALWSYLQMLDPHGDRMRDLPNPAEIGKAIGLSEKQVRRSMTRLVELEFILAPTWLDAKPRNSIEKQVRDRLQSQLGGLTEVVTPAGLSDLLTQTEIIEVKHLSEWKSAMGQILAYSGFYPEHRKRIHLFGKNDEAVIATAMAICLELDITVTFEEVE